MKKTYIAAANNTVASKTFYNGDTLSTAGQPLGTAGQDVRVYKLIIGVPVASANITLFDKVAVTASDTSDIAAKYTLPGTLTASYEFPYERIIDFGKDGFPLDGGNVQIDQNLQLTVLWDFA